MSILGLHHVTATVDEAQPDLDFCLDALGLRLVKKTVNFDNHHVYHFYYGDERGTPGTIWTTFPYAGKNVKVGTKGAGQVVATVFSVPAGSLDEWRIRLSSKGIAVNDLPPRFGDAAIGFSDLSGLMFEMIANDRDPRAPWTDGRVDPGIAIRGLHSVTIKVRDPVKTIDLMSTLLDWGPSDEMAGRIRVAVNGGGPGRWIDIAHDPDAEPAVNGLGTVHHVAMAIGSEQQQLDLREKLIAYGCKVTEIRDRCYFKSIYFREPGNVLFEVATMAPGFAVDEDVPSLGRGLKLPPWEEPHRADIEGALAPITY